MSIKLIPAIDILQGKVVRLLKGDYNKVTEYSEHPLNVARQFHHLGYKHLHVINLNGAKDGHSSIEEILKNIIDIGLSVQIGGGIRSIETAEKYITAGVDKLIVSTTVHLDQTFFKKLRETFGPDKIIVSLDVVGGYVAIEGWKKTLNITVKQAIERLNPKNIIITDISRDGTLSGIDVMMYQDLASQYQEIKIQAAGGISSMEAIQQLEKAGIKGAIVGRAFYEGQLG